MSKALISYDDLKAECEWCTRCELYELRPEQHKIAFSSGSLDVNILMLGEAAGRDEVEQEKVFVGRAGQALNAMLSGFGIGRDNVFIVNSVICRPPDNRDPTVEELSACYPFWHTLVEMVDPKVIVALGCIPMLAITHKREPMYKWRHWFHDDQWHMVGSIPVVPTYHPSYMLRGSEEERDNKLVDVAKDYVAIRRIAGMITRNQ